jgi:hypothetical protein
MERRSSADSADVRLEGATPTTRPELLMQMLARETSETTRTENFVRSVINPLIDFISSRPDIAARLGNSIRLLDQYPTLLESRREFVHGLEENCSPDNINSPLTAWVTHVPLLLHYVALAYHHFHSYIHPFFQTCNAFPELKAFVREREDVFQRQIVSVFKEDVEYPSRLIPVFQMLDRLTERSKDPKRPKVDEAKTKKLMEDATAIWQKCKSAKMDEIPDILSGNGISMWIDPAPRKSTFGKNVLIVEVKGKGDFKDKKRTEPPGKDESRVAFKGKVISKISDETRQNSVQVSNEIEANRRLHHRNVLRMHRYIEDEVFHYMIFPNSENEDLQDIMRAIGPLPEEAARPIFRELILGLQHVHSNGIIHSQICPSCILFYKDHVRLSDFSGCKLDVRDLEKRSKGALVGYMAPETFKGEPFDGARNDIWSCGIILYEMLAGATPFARIQKKKVIEHIKRGAIVYPKSFSCSVLLLLKGVLNPTPSERLSIQQILAHPWMLKTIEIPIGLILRGEPSTVRRSRPSLTAGQMSRRPI